MNEPSDIISLADEADRLRSKVAELEKENERLRQLEFLLGESEKNIQLIFDGASGFAIYELAFDESSPLKAKIVQVSPSIADILGLSDPLNLESWMEHIHPDDRERVLEANFRSWVTGEDLNETGRFYHPIKGEWRWMHAIATGIVDTDTNKSRCFGIIIDISDQKMVEAELTRHKEEVETLVRERTIQLEETNISLVKEIIERRKTESALFESEEKYRLLAETAGEIIVTFDLEGRITYVNASGQKISGYGLDELKTMKLNEVVPENMLQLLYENIEKRISGDDRLFTYDAAFISKDGTIIPVEVCSSLVVKNGEPSFVLLTARDITERKLAEKSLLESEKRYRTLVDTMREGLVEVDADWRITFVNDRFTEMSGYSHEELSGRVFHDLVSPGDQSKAIEEHTLRLRGESGSYHLELIRKDGRKINVLCSPNPTYDSNGNYLGGFGVISDITEIRTYMEELRRNEERFKFLAENMADIVWTTGRDFKATYVSPSVEKILGYTPEERKRQELAEMVTPGSYERILFRYATELDIEQNPDADPDRSITMEVEYYHRDGSTVWMENNVKGIRDESGEIVGMYGSSRDITERKRAERELLIERNKLQAALEKVKMLSGLLPICAYCKKIRDDKGYWNQIESYIRDHSEAIFSHGICPECQKKVYAEMGLIKRTPED